MDSLVNNTTFDVGSMGVVLINGMQFSKDENRYVSIHKNTSFKVVFISLVDNTVLVEYTYMGSKRRTYFTFEFLCSNCKISIQDIHKPVNVVNIIERRHLVMSNEQLIFTVVCAVTSIIGFIIGKVI